MNAVDTNVLIYVHDNRDLIKQAIARKLVDDLKDGLLLWQVACEYLAAARKLAPQGYTREDARQDIEDLRHMWQTALPVWPAIDRANDLFTRYSLSVWDSLLIASCLEADAHTLYTEDFGGPRVIAGLNIVNPFLAVQ